MGNNIKIYPNKYSPRVWTEFIWFDTVVPMACSYESDNESSGSVKDRDRDFADYLNDHQPLKHGPPPNSLINRTGGGKR
jgi:hypothetical protein